MYEVEKCVPYNLYLLLNNFLPVESLQNIEYHYYLADRKLSNNGFPGAFIKFFFKEQIQASVVLIFKKKLSKFPAI